MSRAQRRAAAASEARFRRKAGGAGLTTCLIEAGADLSAHEHGRLFAGAINDALRHPGALCCIACAEPLGPERGFGAWLLSAAAIRPTSASVSAICAPCWAGSSENEIEAACARVLGRLLPGARFQPIESATP